MAAGRLLNESARRILYECHHREVFDLTPVVSGYAANNYSIVRLRAVFQINAILEGKSSNVATAVQDLNTYCDGREPRARRLGVRLRLRPKCGRPLFFLTLE